MYVTAVAQCLSGCCVAAGKMRGVVTREGKTQIAPATRNVDDINKDSVLQFGLKNYRFLGRNRDPSAGKNPMRETVKGTALSGWKLQSAASRIGGGGLGMTARQHSRTKRIR